MKTTAQKALKATFEELKRCGLRDIKFFLANTSEATTEEVCRDVNVFLEAIKTGKSRDHRWNDSGGLLAT